MPELSTHLPFTALKPFFDNAKPDDNITEAWRQQYFGDLERIVHPALVAFFKDLKAEGRMVAIPNSTGYDCRPWKVWDAVASLNLDTAPPSEAARKLDALASLFAHHLTFNIVYPYERILKDGGADAAAAFDQTVAYHVELAKFSKGDIHSHVLGHQNCQRTDLALLLGFKSWVPATKCIMGGRIVDVPVAEPERVQETVVELKTGNLLVADWFRLDEFTKIVTEKHFSLSSRKGMDEQTRYMAEQFGVLRFPALTSPGIFVAGNQVLGGYFNEDDNDVPEGYTHIGNVCTDLWAATFVEYETLVDLVARTSPDSAKEIVDAYIEEHKGGVYGLHQFQVEPGTYYLYHFGENEEFAERAQEAGLKLNEGKIEPFFVFARTRLLPAAAA